MMTPTNRPSDRPTDRPNIEQSAFSKVRQKVSDLQKHFPVGSVDSFQQEHHLHPGGGSRFVKWTPSQLMSRK